jgi:GNAT superfamily N-acetyltransferase
MVDRTLSADEGADGVIEEIRGGWDSLESFFARGFGTVARPDGRIAGWCLTDWVVGDAIEIGIETYPDHRREGWAKRMAEGTLTLAAARGIRRAGWHCWAYNTGSARTALAAGYTLTASFPVRFGWCDERSNHLVNGTYWLKGRPDAGVLPDPARAARHYAAALDIGWEWGGWGGTPWVYWNAACAHYRAGLPDRARVYLKAAIERGWRYPDSIAVSPRDLVMPADDAVAALACLPENPNQG